MECHLYMVDHLYQEDDLPKSIEYSDLFDLDDPALEAELQLLSTPISNNVVLMTMEGLHLLKNKWQGGLL